MKLKDFVLIPLFATLIYVLELALSFLPNIQLTVFLIVFFTKKLGLIKTSIIVLLYVILDTIFSYFNPIFFITMLSGWLVIVLLVKLLGKTEKSFILALIGSFGSLIYCWLYIIPNVFLWNVNFTDYLIADLPFEALIFLSSFLSILILYQPLSKLFLKIYPDDSL